MLTLIGLYINLIVFLGIGVLIVISLLFWNSRYRNNHGRDIPYGFERTEEVTVDPIDGKKYRVYYNAKTGERFYHEE